MTPEEIVDRAYELISFAAGGAPAWVEFRELFANPCALALRIFPGDAAITVVDLDGYMRAQMREGLSEEGYSELPGDRAVTIVGDVACVHQSFTMRFVDCDIPAIDVFALARMGETWRIVSIVSDLVAAASS